MKAQARCSFVRRSVVIGLVLAAASTVARAGDNGRSELGITLASLSALREGNQYDYDYGYSGTTTVWVFSVPGNSVLGAFEPGVHATFPVSNRMSLEPQFGVMHFRQGDSVTVFTLGLQVNVALRPWRSKTAYLFGRGGLTATFGDSSDAQGILGGGVGYRLPIRDHVVVRWEAYYNRYLDPHLDQFGARMKVGLLF